MANPYPLQQLFFGLPEQQVLDLRNRALALATEGKTIMEVQGRGGQMTQKQFAMPPAQVLFEARAALKSINPAVYGLRKRKSYGFAGYNSNP